MAKKTTAYSEGYSTGQARIGKLSNPYSETDQHELYSEWVKGYTDGVNSKVGDDEDYERNDDEEDYD